jgi:hypothetical protein
MPTDPNLYRWSRSRSNYLFLRSRQRPNNIASIIQEADGRYAWRAWRNPCVRTEGYADSEELAVAKVYSELGLAFA